MIQILSLMCGHYSMNIVLEQTQTSWIPSSNLQDHIIVKYHLKWADYLEKPFCFCYFITCINCQLKKIASKGCRVKHLTARVICILRGLGIMVFNATFNNTSVISWRSVLLVEETGVPGENH
jgi:hypothetical protein